MCSSVDSGLRWWGDKLLIHCKARTVQCPLSTKKWTTFACGHWSVDLENLSVFYLVPIWVPTHHPATLHLRNWDALQPKHERAKEGKWWIVWAESEITLSHQVPLLCVSSLACLWGGGQRSSSAGLNILFTNTLLDTHTHTQQIENTISQQHVFGLHLRLHTAPLCGAPRLHALHVYAPNVGGTHPSRSISSALKVNTWGRGNICCKPYALLTKKTHTLRYSLLCLKCN